MAEFTEKEVEKEVAAEGEREDRAAGAISDMTHGPLLGKMLWFALPLAISSILQQMFNAVDLAVVGRFASEQAQAAVGGNGPLINLLINLFVGVAMGGNVMIARFIGQGKKERIQAAIHTTMLVAVLGGLVLMCVGPLVARPLLAAMNTPADVLDLAAQYLTIYFAGMPFIMTYNFGAAILRSMGDTKRPLICLVVAGCLNAVLNLFFVIVCHWDAAGVALGTVISNAVSCCMVLYILTHEAEPMRLNLRLLRISPPEFRQILQIGIPAGLQGMVFSITNIFVQTALNGYGSDAMAGSAAALNFEYGVYFIITAFTSACSTFVSQNFGAGKYDRCRRVFWLALAGSALTTLVLCLIIVPFREIFVAIFTDKPQVAAYAQTRVLYLMTPYVVICTYEIAAAALRGIGVSLTPTVITVFGTCVLRLAWIYFVCPRYPHFEVLLLAYPISWTLTGVGLLAAYAWFSRRILK